MNIVLINHYAGSPYHGMEYRPYYLAREWVAAGHQVSILAGSFSHVRRINKPASRQSQAIDGISYHWFPTTPYSGNGPRRFFNILQFVGSVYQEAALLATHLRPDVVIASSTYPLDILAAHRLSRLAKARLIFEIHDLWPLSPIEIGGMDPAHPFVRLMGWAEGRALSVADKVVSMLPYTKPYLQSRGMAAEKFHYVPNGFYPREWTDDSEAIDNSIRNQVRELRKKFPFLVGYTGSHGAANALEHFVEAAASVRKHGIGFVLVGQGPLKDALIASAQSRRSDNILFLEAVAKRQIPALLQEFDSVYIGWRALSLYHHGVSPNKLFDYMMAERPVIHGINAEANLVSEAKCGLTVPAENVSALAEACLRLSRLATSELAKMGRNGREYVVANHDYRTLARRFEQIIAPAY